MTKDHVKRIAAPKAWGIKRKANKYVAKARPGALNKELSVPMTVFFKDMAKIATTTREVKYVLNHKTVLVNGIQVKNYRAPVGFMDNITISETKQTFRILFNKQGKLISIEIPAKENIILAKIVGKTMIKGGKTQLNFLNGYNTIVEKDDFNTGDTVVLDNGKVKTSYKFEKGSFVFLTGGKQIGSVGTVEDIKGEKIIFKNQDNQVNETDKRYGFVVGDKKAVITLN